MPEDDARMNADEQRMTSAARDSSTARNSARERVRAQRARVRNNVRRLREERLLSKAELARRAGVSPLTIDRIESGMPCRMDTKRKIILALGMTIAEKDLVFLRDDEDVNEPSSEPG